MDRRIAAAFCMAALGLGISAAHAGPCSAKIAQFRTRSATIRRDAERRAVCPAVNRRADRSPTNASLYQTGQGTGTGAIRSDPGARQAA